MCPGLSFLCHCSGPLFHRTARELLRDGRLVISAVPALTVQMQVPARRLTPAGRGALRSSPCLICAYANGDCLSVGMVTRSAVASISLATYW
jgi:hypothetical protein